MEGSMNINGRMKVKTLKSQFETEFGLTLRVYDGRSFADDESTLASIRKGDSKGGEFAPRKNTKIGNLEDKVEEMFGIKVQIAGSDDSYLCGNDLTLLGAFEKDEKKLGRKIKKEAKSADVVVASDSDPDSHALYRLAWYVENDDGAITKEGKFDNAIEYVFFETEDIWDSICEVVSDEGFFEKVKAVVNSCNFSEKQYTFIYIKSFKAGDNEYFSGEDYEITDGGERYYFDADNNYKLSIT
jgi:hypothetical protein